jgi:hypothetical protein
VGQQQIGKPEQRKYLDGIFSLSINIQSWQPFQVIRHSLQDMLGMCLGSTAVTQDLATKPAGLSVGLERWLEYKKEKN